MKNNKIQLNTDLKKAIHKAILKNIKNKSNKDIAQAVVNDILDPNSVAEVDNDKIPPQQKTGVMNKSKHLKSQDKKEKGVSKLKKFLKKKCK